MAVITIKQFFESRRVNGLNEHKKCDLNDTD